MKWFISNERKLLSESNINYALFKKKKKKRRCEISNKKPKFLHSPPSPPPPPPDSPRLLLWKLNQDSESQALSFLVYFYSPDTKWSAAVAET